MDTKNIEIEVAVVVAIPVEWPDDAATENLVVKVDGGEIMSEEILDWRRAIITP